MDLTKILKAGEKCKPGFHKMPDGSCMSDEEMKKKAEGVQKGKEGVFNGNAYVDPDGNPWGAGSGAEPTGKVARATGAKALAKEFNSEDFLSGSGRKAKVSGDEVTITRPVYNPYSSLREKQRAHEEADWGKDGGNTNYFAKHLGIEVKHTSTELVETSQGKFKTITKLKVTSYTPKTTKGEQVLGTGSGRAPEPEPMTELFTMSWASGGPLVVKAYHKKKRRMY